MSDQSNTPESGESILRPSAEEKRAQETVMLNSQNLSDLVSEAKGEDPAPAPSATAAASPTGEGSKGTSTSSLVIGVVAVAVIAALVVVVLLVR